jgi:NADPH:quinone reductase-like Zn-dependent oxidoreductase
MKAVVVTKYGDADGLEITQVDRPRPKEMEILVKVHATTVTHGDAMLRRMGFGSRLILGLFMGGLRKGKILGHEFSGTIEATGSSVSRFRVGDEVFASAGMRGGAHAEYICIAEDSMVAGKPKNLSFEQAAAVPVGANTALDILRKGDVQRGKKILIYGASGSVGSYAVQLARHWGADVTAVTSAGNFDWVRALGATEMIDYRTSDITQAGESYDVVFDAVRKLSSSEAKSVLNEDGLFLSVRSSTKESAENLAYIKGLIESGELEPVIDRTYCFEEIAEAHRHVDTGHKKGNVVVSVVPRET